MIAGRRGKPSEVLLDLVVDEDGTVRDVANPGRLDGRTLRLSFQFGDMRGDVDAVRVNEYAPRPLTLRDRLKPRVASVRRWINARARPTGAENARIRRERGESLDSIISSGFPRAA